MKETSQKLLSIISKGYNLTHPNTSIRTSRLRFFVKLWFTLGSTSLKKQNHENKVQSVRIELFPPLQQQHTKSTADMSISKFGNGKYSKSPTIQEDDRSRLTSKASIANALESRLVGHLTPHDKMNSLALGVKDFLELLPALDPSKIEELQGLYNPSISWQGPKIDQDSGATYSGQVQQNCANGWGIFINSKGDYIEGFFQDGYLNTFCRWIHRKGKFYQGCIKNGMLEGKGVLKDKYGISIDTTWNQNKASGYTRITSADKKILAKAQAVDIDLKTAANGHVVVFEGTIEDGKSQGVCYLLNAKEEFFYRGDFVNDEFHGQGEKVHFSKKHYRGQFVQGKEEGEGELMFPDGRIFRGMFAEGLPHGAGQMQTDSGDIKTVVFVKGRLLLPTDQKTVK